MLDLTGNFIELLPESFPGDSVWYFAESVVAS
jgi:hypothetical protein